MSAKGKKFRLELDENARIVLGETLHSKIGDLSVEIARTDRMSFRNGLKARKKALEEVLEALDPQTADA